MTAHKERELTCRLDLSPENGRSSRGPAVVLSPSAIVWQAKSGFAAFVPDRFLNNPPSVGKRPESTSLEGSQEDLHSARNAAASSVLTDRILGGSEIPREAPYHGAPAPRGPSSRSRFSTDESQDIWTIKHRRCVS